MTFQFDNFENQPVGSQPDGWNVETTTDKFEITDVDPIAGSRSWVVSDSTDRVPAATNSGDATVSLVLWWNTELTQSQISTLAQNLELTVT